MSIATGIAGLVYVVLMVGAAVATVAGWELQSTLLRAHLVASITLLALAVVQRVGSAD